MIPLLLIIIGTLTVTGIINRTRAIAAGRRGYRFFQPIFDVQVLFQKSTIYSSSSTIITRIAPAIYLSAIVVAALTIPFGKFGAIVSFSGDVVLFCYLLTLSRISLVWAAMDSGAGFQSLGASRESLWAMLAEPALFLLIGTLCLITSHYSFSDIFASFDNMSLNLLILSVVVGYGFFKLALVECSRIPINDSRTHLELTMAHEAMVLDWSGVDMAFLTIGGWIKLSIFSLLFINSLVPARVDGWLLVALYLALLLLYGVLIGLVESTTARNRLNKNATYIVSISAISLMAFIVAYILSVNLL